MNLNGTILSLTSDDIANMILWGKQTEQLYGECRRLDRDALGEDGVYWLSVVGFKSGMDCYKSEYKINSMLKAVNIANIMQLDNYIYDIGDMIVDDRLEPVLRDLFGFLVKRSK